MMLETFFSKLLLIKLARQRPGGMRTYAKMVDVLFEAPARQTVKTEAVQHANIRKDV